MRGAVILILPALMLAPRWAAADPAAPGTGPQDWYVHLGPGEIVYGAGAKIRLDGVAVPAATVSVPSEGAALFEVGHFLTPHIAASLMAGWPPAAVLNGAGALRGLQLGKVVYGPAMATAHYHFDVLGPYFRPYFGGGAAYAIVFEDKSEALGDLHVHNAFGSVLQAGFESDVARHIGIFFDARKVYLSSTVTGSAFGERAKAAATLNPSIFSTGVDFRF